MVSQKCEICNRVASSGIRDVQSTTGIIMRFSCEDHYLALHDKIINEKKQMITKK